jgi:hypothetical protein
MRLSSSGSVLSSSSVSAPCVSVTRRGAGDSSTTRIGKREVERLLERVRDGTHLGAAALETALTGGEFAVEISANQDTVGVGDGAIAHVARNVIDVFFVEPSSLSSIVIVIVIIMINMDHHHHHHQHHHVDYH